MNDATQPQATTPPYLKGMTLSEMETLLVSGGFKPFRAKQLFHWVQHHGVRNFDDMINLPKDLRHWMKETVQLGGIHEAPTIKESADGSFKFLYLLDDGKKVESVLMPDPKRNYWTQCLSSQVGCAVDCKFCVTGLNGFFRQMRTDEIVDQVLFAKRYLYERNPEANFRNLVYMGMGEPLLNADAVIKSIELLTDEKGLNLSPRRITVSTSGIIPGMIKLSESGVGAGLALSLNGSDDASREKVMPINKKYPIKDVLEVIRNYTFRKNRPVTFEYVLIAGVNDTLEDARKLVEMLDSIRCKVNLIPYNPSPFLPFERPSRNQVFRFEKILTNGGLNVSVRWSKALDVDGACGQLAGESKQRKPRPEAVAVGVQQVMGDLDFFATVVDDDDSEEE